MKFPIFCQKKKKVLEQIGLNLDKDLNRAYNHYPHFSLFLSFSLWKGKKKKIILYNREIFLKCIKDHNSIVYLWLCILESV